MPLAPYLAWSRILPLLSEHDICSLSRTCTEMRASIQEYLSTECLSLTVVEATSLLPLCSLKNAVLPWESLFICVSEYLDWNALAPLLSCCTKLRVLALEFQYSTPNKYLCLDLPVLILGAIPKSTNLQSLSLIGFVLGTEGSSALASFLDTRSVRHLTVASCKLNYGNLFTPLLASAHQPLACIRQISLRHNRLPPPDVTSSDGAAGHVLGKALMAMTAIEDLDLNNCYVDAQVVKGWKSQHVSFPWKLLHQWDFGGNFAISSAGFSSLFQMMPLLCNLTKLSLQMCSLKDDSLDMLVRTLSLSGSPLHSLVLDRNRLTDRAAMLLARCWRKEELSNDDLRTYGMLSLQYCSLSHNQIGDEGITALATALELTIGAREKPLHLNLSKNYFRADGMRALAQLRKRSGWKISY